MSQNNVCTTYFRMLGRRPNHRWVHFSEQHVNRVIDECERELANYNTYMLGAMFPSPASNNYPAIER